MNERIHMQLQGPPFIAHLSNRGLFHRTSERYRDSERCKATPDLRLHKIWHKLRKLLLKKHSIDYIFLVLRSRGLAKHLSKRRNAVCMSLETKYTVKILLKCGVNGLYREKKRSAKRLNIWNIFPHRRIASPHHYQLVNLIFISVTLQMNLLRKSCKSCSIIARLLCVKAIPSSKLSMLGVWFPTEICRK